MSYENDYEERVERICAEVRRILLDEGSYSQGVMIRINMCLDEVDSLDFEVKGKVKFGNGTVT